MKKKVVLVLIGLILISIPTIGCIPETPPFKIALDDCDVRIDDRITGETYFTTKPYYTQLDSSRIMIEAGYKQLRNSLGWGLGAEAFEETIILSGNWKLTKI